MPQLRILLRSHYYQRGFCEAETVEANFCDPDYRPRELSRLRSNTRSYLGTQNYYILNAGVPGPGYKPALTLSTST